MTGQCRVAQMSFTELGSLTKYGTTYAATHEGEDTVGERLADASERVDQIGRRSWRLLIGGSLVSGDAATTTTVDPSTGQVLAEVPDASDGQVDGAVAAALASQTGWRRTDLRERAALVRHIATTVEEYGDELCTLDAVDAGIPLNSMGNEVRMAVELVSLFADHTLALAGETLRFGYAGGATAIAARDAELDVLVVEKMPHPGGLSIASGGGIGMATDADAAFRCLQAACAGRTPDDVLRAFASELVDLPDWIRSLAETSSVAFEVEEVHAGAGYDLPGSEAFGWILLRDLDGFDGFPWAKGLRGGARLFRILLDNVESRGIPVLYETPAQKLIAGADGEVLGAWVERDGRRTSVLARRGVVLACGGFEWSSSDNTSKLSQCSA